MLRIRNPKDFLAGLLFTGLAAMLAYSALLLPLGTAHQMGPGYFPFALSMILGGLGLAVIVNSLRVAGERMTHFAWRGYVLVILAIVAFGLAINRLGFIPAVAMTVGICMLASNRFRPLSATALIGFLLVFCWAVFVWGLGLPVRLFGA